MYHSFLKPVMSKKPKAGYWIFRRRGSYKYVEATSATLSPVPGRLRSFQPGFNLSKLLEKETPSLMGEGVGAIKLSAASTQRLAVSMEGND